MLMSEPDVHDALCAINRAWREGRPSDMANYLHPGITMVLPRFSGTIVGSESLIAGFSEFCSNARVLEYMESDEQIHVIGDVAIASFRFFMVYERATYRERSTGRDMWVFERSGTRWRAVWRTMTDLQETRE